MQPKHLVAISVSIGLVLFLFLGMPYLKTVKGSASSLSFGFGKDNSTFSRPVQVDISIEDVCVNVVTGDIDAKCLSKQGCDSTCKVNGCKMFGLKFNSSQLDDRRCLCNCIEENKITKALNIKQAETE